MEHAGHQLRPVAHRNRVFRKEHTKCHWPRPLRIFLVNTLVRIKVKNTELRQKVRNLAPFTRRSKLLLNKSGKVSFPKESSAI
jgi:hypothetical protein